MLVSCLQQGGDVGLAMEAGARQKAHRQAALDGGLREARVRAREILPAHLEAQPRQTLPARGSNTGSFLLSSEDCPWPVRLSLCMLFSVQGTYNFLLCLACAASAAPARGALHDKTLVVDAAGDAYARALAFIIHHVSARQPPAAAALPRMTRSTLKPCQPAVIERSLQHPAP